MPEILLYSLIIFFIVLCIGFLIYISMLLKKLKLNKSQQEASALEHASKAQEQKNYLIDSIRIISRSVVDGQCPMTEGCIRLKVLIDNYSPLLHDQRDLHVIEIVYNKTSHIPTLEAWKQLSSKEKLLFQKEIDSLELEHAEEIRKAAEFLKDYPFEQRIH